MIILLEKAMLLACGTAVASFSGFDIALLIGLLIAISLSCISEWLIARQSSPKISALPVGCFIVATMLMPHWCVLLPVTAYDTLRLPAIMHDARVDYAIKCLPFAPIMSAMISVSSMHDRWMILVTMPLVALGMMLGRSRTTVMQLRQSLRRTQDLTRDSNRVHRRRMADVAEERSQSIRAATLSERTRIAREIHDNVGHLLTRAIMQSQAGKAVADATNNPIAAQSFSELNATLSEAMTMVRRSVHDLEDDGTDFAAQIADAAHTFGDASADFNVMVSNDIIDAPAPVARCFATVIRESLSNVARHSEAKSATVTLRDFPALWQLIVQDPGPAKPSTPAYSESAPADTEVFRGMGLSDIEYRVRSLGGTSSCGPYGNGWRVFVTIPKQQWTYHNRGE